MDEAVEVGGVGDQALPVEEIGGAFNCVWLARAGVKFKMHGPVWLRLNRWLLGEFHGQEFSSAFGSGRIFGHVQVAGVVRDNAVPNIDFGVAEPSRGE